MRDEPLVLGIETSCDETGVGIVRGHTLLADALASSVDQHARFGGVVPEVASRAHLEAMVPTMQRALDEAGVTLADIDAIAVTAGPGLAGALLVGVAAAKGYALAADKPIYGVNHLAAHVAVDTLEHGPLPEPAVAMLVSGGHSSLLLVDDLTAGVQPLGATIDDAAGEAFDKVGRLLGLPYPGGPHIDRLAREGDPTAIRVPRGLTAATDQAKHADDFSFSGLKTAVTRWVEAREDAGEPIPLEDVSASFAAAVAEVVRRLAEGAYHQAPRAGAASGRAHPAHATPPGPARRPRPGCRGGTGRPGPAAPADGHRDVRGVRRAGRPGAGRRLPQRALRGGRRCAEPRAVHAR